MTVQTDHYYGPPLCFLLSLLSPTGHIARLPGQSICTACEQGTATNAQRSACEKCPAGQYSPGKATDCILCTPGKFTSSLATLGGCTDCPAGKFTARVGSPVCQNCAAGQYADTAGSTRCIPCSTLQTSLPGAQGCKCAPGTFVDMTVAANCTLCDTGRYASDLDTGECRVCPQGSYTNSETPGATGCLPCPPGTEKGGGVRSTCTGKWKSLGPGGASETPGCVGQLLEANCSRLAIGVPLLRVCFNLRSSHEALTVQGRLSYY